MDNGILVGRTSDGNRFCNIHGIVYQMLRRSYAFLESKETTGEENQWYVEETHEYAQKNGQF